MSRFGFNLPTSQSPRLVNSSINRPSYQLVNLFMLSAKSLETARMGFRLPTKGKLLTLYAARGFLDDVLCFFYWAFLFPTLTHSRNKVGTALARIV